MGEVLTGDLSGTPPERVRMGGLLGDRDQALYPFLIGASLRASMVSQAASL